MIEKIIIPLMAVSMMLTSCGKSAELSSRNKGADNKTPATNTSTKTLPQKIDNNIKQFLTNYVKDHIFVIAPIAIIVATIVVGSIVWIIKNKNKSPQTTEPEKQPQPSKPPEAQPEAGGSSQAIEQPEPKEQPKPSQTVEQNELLVFDIRFISDKSDFEVSCLSYPDAHLTAMIKADFFFETAKLAAAAELKKRELVSVIIPTDFDHRWLLVYSVRPNEVPKSILNDNTDNTLIVDQKKAIEFILKVRNVIE